MCIERVLLQVGFTRAHVSVRLRELLPPDFTLTRDDRLGTLILSLPAGGMFLWHFPSGRPDRTLSCTLPYEARTFLTAMRRGRPAYSARRSIAHV